MKPEGIICDKCHSYPCNCKNQTSVSAVASNVGLVASLEDVKRLIDSPTLTAACGCYSEKTGGATAAYFALDKVTLRVQKIIDEISN